jgi:hypothetical protein
LFSAINFEMREERKIVPQDSPHVHLHHVDALVYQLLARGGPGEPGVAPDQQEGLTCDVHAAGVVARPVKVFLAVDAGRPESFLRSPPQEGVMVLRLPRSDYEGIRAAV